MRAAQAARVGVRESLGRRRIVDLPKITRRTLVLAAHLVPSWHPASR